MSEQQASTAVNDAVAMAKRAEVEDEAAARRPRRSFYQRWIDEWWLAELSSASASCLLTLALCLILWNFDGQPVPNFGSVLKSGITLGTIAALLATLIVASALTAIQECLGQLKWLWFYRDSRPMRDIELYDRASRSSIGSFRLLLQQRARDPITSIGAFLVVAHLLIVPLVQQSIVYVSVAVQDSSTTATARAPIAQSWWDDNADPALDPAVVSASMFAGYTSVGPQAKGAIINGFYYGPLALNDTSPLCSSGNCTFPDYASLGICAYAANITAHLHVTGNYSAMTAVACLPGDFCLEQGNPDVGNAVANVSTSTELALNLQANISSDVSTLLNFTPIAFTNHSNPLTDVYVIYDNRNGYTAIEFVFDWCIPTFSTQVGNGLAVSRRVEALPLDLRYEPSDITNHFPGSLIDTVDGIDYTISLSAHASLQRYFQSLLNGIALLSESYLVDNDQIQVICNALNVFQTSNTDGDLPPTAQNLTVLHTLLDNVATSMTNAIRTVDNQSVVAGALWDSHKKGTFVAGTVYTQQNIVHIYWGWVVPPIFFAALSLVFVVLVVCRRGKRSVGQRNQPLVWKTSQLASLRGLDPGIQRHLGGMTQRGKMDISAREITVRLVATEDGWHLAHIGAPAEVIEPTNHFRLSRKPLPQSKVGMSDPLVTRHENHT